MDEVLSLHPFREEHNKISLVVPGDVEIRWVSTEAARESVGDGLLRLAGSGQGMQVGVHQLEWHYIIELDAQRSPQKEG